MPTSPLKINKKLPHVSHPHKTSDPPLAPPRRWGTCWTARRWPKSRRSCWRTSPAGAIWAPDPGSRPGARGSQPADGPHGRVTRACTWAWLCARACLPCNRHAAAPFACMRACVHACMRACRALGVLASQSLPMTAFKTREAQREAQLTAQVGGRRGTGHRGRGRRLGLPSAPRAWAGILTFRVI
jgi:hypothetical protein